MGGRGIARLFKLTIALGHTLRIITRVPGLWYWLSSVNISCNKSIVVPSGGLMYAFLAAGAAE